MVHIDIDPKYRNIEKMKKEFINKKSRRARLISIKKALKEMDSYSSLEPCIYPFLAFFLREYENTLSISKNPNVNTEHLEKEVALLYKNVVESSKLSFCKQEFMNKYQKELLQMLCEIYDKCIQAVHMTVNKTKLNLSYYRFLSRVHQIYEDLSFLIEVLPITPSNAYMFGNICLFLKQNYIEKENISTFLERKNTQKYLMRR